MLIVVAIKAKQFPVAAIRRVVVVVMVFVVNGELPQVLAAKFAAAALVDPGVKL